MEEYPTVEIYYVVQYKFNNSNIWYMCMDFTNLTDAKKYLKKEKNKDDNSNLNYRIVERITTQKIVYCQTENL